MLLNLTKQYKILLNKKKKKYFFYGLVCLKSRIKFKNYNNLILIKINNNMAIRKQKETDVIIKIKENKIYLSSKKIFFLNKLVKQLSFFCKSMTFI